MVNLGTKHMQFVKKKPSIKTEVSGKAVLFQDFIANTGIF